MPTATAAITRVATQPSRRWIRGAVNGPITEARPTTIIIVAMIGTEIRPFRTALQNRALIGSSGELCRAKPKRVANPMTA